MYSDSSNSMSSLRIEYRTCNVLYFLFLTQQLIMILYISIVWSFEDSIFGALCRLIVRINCCVTVQSVQSIHRYFERMPLNAVIYQYSAVSSFPCINPWNLSLRCNVS
eukprot:421220_1